MNKEDNYVKNRLLDLADITYLKISMHILVF